MWRQLPNTIKLSNGTEIDLYSILNKRDAEIPTIESITRHNAEDAFNKHFEGHSTEIADYVIVKCSNDYYIIWLNGPPTDDNQYNGIKAGIISIKDDIINVTLASKEKRKSNNKKSEDGKIGGSRRSRYSKKSKRSKRSKQTRRSKK